MIAALLGAGQAEPLAEQVKQGHPGVDALRAAGAIDADGDLGHAFRRHVGGRHAACSIAKYMVPFVLLTTMLPAYPGPTALHLGHGTTENDAA